jgi:hypothetical protein
MHATDSHIALHQQARYQGLIIQNEVSTSMPLQGVKRSKYGDWGFLVKGHFWSLISFV